MITYAVYNAENIQIVSIKTRSCFRLNDLYGLMDRQWTIRH